jgi:hypothetical protein
MPTDSFAADLRAAGGDPAIRAGHALRSRPRGGACARSRGRGVSDGYCLCGRQVRLSLSVVLGHGEVWPRRGCRGFPIARFAALSRCGERRLADGADADSGERRGDRTLRLGELFGAARDHCRSYSSENLHERPSWGFARRWAPRRRASHDVLPATAGAAAAPRRRAPGTVPKRQVVGPAIASAAFP